VPHILGGQAAFGHYVEAILPDFARPAGGEHGELAVVAEWGLMTWSVLVGLAGIIAAWWCYVRRPETPGLITARIPRAYGLAADNFRVDETYERLIVEPVVRAAENTLEARVDQGFIEGIINGLASGIGRASRGLSRLQGGRIRGYVALMIIGTLMIILLTLV